MSVIRIGLPSESYYLEATAGSDQRLINVQAEPLPAETGVPFILKGTPGLTQITDPSNGGPVRGIVQLRINAPGGIGNVLYVSADTVFLENTGVSTSVGTIDPAGDLTMATDGGNVLICCNNRVFLFNGTSTSEISTSLPFVGSSVTWVEGYYVLTSTEQIFFISGLNDPTSFDPLDFATAQGGPDDIALCLQSHLDLWLFCTNHVEIWYLSGAADFAFERQLGGIIEYGTFARASPTNADNSIFWLGNDFKVYRADGYSPKCVSTPSVERWLASHVISDAIGMSTSASGHNCYVLNFPTADATWSYDSTNNKWFELSSAANGIGRWRGNCSFDQTSYVIIGDVQSGKLFSFDATNFTEHGSAVYREVQFPALYGGGNPIYPIVQFPNDFGGGRYLYMYRLILDFFGAGQTVTLQWSKDGGATFTSPGRTLTTNGLRTFFTRLGSFRRMILRVSGTFTSEFALIDAQADVDGGIS